MQREFEKVIKEHIQKAATQGAAASSAANGLGEAKSLVPGSLFDRSRRTGGGGGGANKKHLEEEEDAIVHDLEELASPSKRSVQTISHHVSLANGHLKKKGVTMANGVANQANGHIPNGKMNFKNVLEEAENYPIHSYM